MTDHLPFSVAVTVRVSCRDRDILFAAAKASLLRSGNSGRDIADISAGWEAADALAELISEGLGRIPADDATGWPPARDTGIEITELERSYSGESDVGLDDDDTD